MFIVEFFRKLFETPLSPIQKVKRDALVDLLSRVDSAEVVHVSSEIDVYVEWPGVDLYLTLDYAYVRCTDGEAVKDFNVSYKLCPEAKAVRDSLYLQYLKRACSMSLNATPSKATR